MPGNEEGRPESSVSCFRMLDRTAFPEHHP